MKTQKNLALPELSIDQQRAAHYAYLGEVMPELVARLAWSRAQIDAYQTQVFRDFLRHVKAHSPWHAKRAAHLDPATATPADLASLPIMDKNDMMDNWDAIVTVPGASRLEAEEALRAHTDQFYIWGDNVLLASGGSGGRPGLFLYDWFGMAMLWGGMGRGFYSSLSALAKQGIDLPGGVRMCSVAAEKSAHGSYILSRVFSNPNNPTHRLSGWRSNEDVIAKLNAIQPHFIFCYPTLIHELAEAANSGQLKIEPSVIYLGSEHLSDTVRDLARRTWPGTAILTCWGTSEGGGTFPCPCGDGFHVCEDLCIIEPVDSRGRPVPPGQRAHGIYFTNLFNKALPIIRYFIDDIFEMAEGPCACGSHFLKVRQVHGRTLDNFYYGDIAILPVTLELAVLEQPSVLEYQIRQTPRGAHLVYRSINDVDEARLHRKMHDTLVNCGLQAPEITIERADTMKRTAAGKLIRFVPLPQ